MRVLYVYDIQSSNRKEYNRIKRRFYYRLNKLFEKNFFWKTESCLIVPVKSEGNIDSFFRGFRPNILVYKTHISFLRRLK